MVEPAFPLTPEYCASRMRNTPVIALNSAGKVKCGTIQVMDMPVTSERPVGSSTATGSPTGGYAALAWREGFAALGPAFFTRLQPTALPAPYWVDSNPALARELGLHAWTASAQALAALSGNAVPVGTQALASVYSGHQFGQWAGQLGDGRAILLGELQIPDGSTREIQLKGAGLTPYSRMGDGRAVLRSSIREYLCSEAMHGLSIPTTRALSITGSDAPVRREEVETAAVVSRVAPSFLRFGHFEHFSYGGHTDQLKILADYVIDHFYLGCRNTERFSGNPYAALLEAVSERTAHLLAQWQAVGFCHGVMNTDNMSILGLTIDYGPFQFLDGFNPAHICNHSDTQGRYSFNRQPNIAYWNLFCLGQALLPLIGEQEIALAALESYKTVFPQALQQRMSAKLGLAEAHDGDKALIEDVLQLLAAEQVDYTIFWRRLSHAVAGDAPESVRDLFIDRTAFDVWMLRYKQRLLLAAQPNPGARMLAVNPKYVLRNHLGEQAIQLARKKDFSEVAVLRKLLAAPCDEHSQYEDRAGFPPDWAAGIEISCSS